MKPSISEGEDLAGSLLPAIGLPGLVGRSAQPRGVGSIFYPIGVRFGV